MLKNMVERMVVIQISVMPAFRERGSLNAVMPSLIASMPVSAVHPLENARRIRNAVSPSSAVCTDSTPVTVPSVPVKYWK